MTVLVGGWGYGNIGDDLLLRNYVKLLGESNLTVLSVNPDSTASAIAAFDLPTPNLVIRKELSSPRSDIVLVCGGGYINGDWRGHCTAKLIRLLKIARSAEHLIVHAIEARNLHLQQIHLLRIILRNASVSVRDRVSQLELRKAGIEATLVPDALALSSPDAPPSKSSPEAPVFINILDIPSRPDRHEACFPWEQWEQLIQRVIRNTMPPIEFLANDPAEAQYAENLFPGYRVRLAESSTNLRRLLETSRGIISTRMHYGLLASQMGKAARIIPYNGKVIPTLDALGMGYLVLDPSCPQGTSPGEVHVKSAEQWHYAKELTGGWLNQALLRR